MKIALLSDIHANIHALDSVYRDLSSVSVDKILIAGDLIGYYYWPREVVEKLMNDERVFCIRGNHETILESIQLGFSEASEYRRKYGSGYDVCLEQLSEAHLAWLFGLPRNLTVSFSGISFFLGHGSLHDTDEYLYPDADSKRLEANYSNETFTVYGHTHYPFIHSWEKRFLINPGSVGQPRDVGGLASYAIVNTDNLSIRFRRCIFNTNEVIDTVAKIDPKIKYLSTIMSR